MADARDRPSVPHHFRVPTDRQRTVPREPDPDPSPEAETVREQIDPEVAELISVLRDPSGISVDTLLKLLNIGQQRAVIATRKDDKLRVELNVGQISEKLDSMIGTAVGKRRRREWASLVGLVLASALATGQALWNTLAPRAREAAEVAVIAPAIEAKRVAEVTSDRTDEHASRLDSIEDNQRALSAAVEKLNGAVVSLIDRLPPPEPTQIHVPATIAKPRRTGG